MQFQARHPDQTEWQDIDEATAHRWLAASYRDVDEAIESMRAGIYAPIVTGTVIRIKEADRDTALIAPKPVQVEDDGEILYA